MLKQVILKYNSTSLILKIVIGMFLGLILAVCLPKWVFISIFGTLFVNALKAIAPILVFALIVSSFACSTSVNDGGHRFRTVICLYLISTLLSTLCAVGVSFLFPTTLQLGQVAQPEASIEGINQVFASILSSIVSNPIQSIIDANYIGILFWAIITGLILKNIAQRTTKDFLTDISIVTTEIVKGIINCAPFGIMGLVFTAVSSNGLAVFADYSRLLCVIIGGMLFIAFVVSPIIVGIFLKENPYPLVLLCLRESGITAFFTRSSAANIPVNMNLCEKLGINKNFYSISLPLGATINMNGAAVTIAIMTLCTVHTLGLSVDMPTAIMLSLLVTVAAAGTSGVSGGSLLLIPMACSLFGIGQDISMQVVGIGFIIGVVQDSFETALNSSSDVLFTVTAEFHDTKQKANDVIAKLK